MLYTAGVTVCPTESHAMSDFETEDGLVKLFAQAMCIMQEREFGEAIRLFDRVLEMEPTMARALALRGACKFFLLRHDEAREDFDSALEVDPYCVPALAYRGQYFAYNDDFAQALADLEQALEIDAENDHALRVRLKMFLQLGQIHDAEADANALLARHPDDDETLFQRGWIRMNTGRPDEAWEDNNRLMELNPDDAETLLQRAHFFNAEARYEDVVRTVDRLLREPHERGPQPIHLKCWALLALGRNDEALELLENTFEAEPLPIILYAEAIALGRLERLDECKRKIEETIPCAEKAERSDVARYMEYLLNHWTPERAKTLCILNFDRELLLWPRAMEVLELEDHVAALKLFDEILQIAPISTQAYNYRALILGFLNRYAEALDSIGTGLQIQNSPVLLFRKAMLLLDMERYEEALVYFDQVAAAAPDVAVHYHRARLFHLQGEYAQAVLDLTEALRLAPHDDATLLLRARCYVDMKQYDKALGDFAQVLYYMPDHVGALHGRAKQYFDREQFELAVKDETQALKRSPDFQPGLALRGRAWGGLAQDARQAEKRGEPGIPVSFPELAEGKFYDAEQCWKNAFADFDLSIELEPGDLGVRWDRGYFAHRRKDYDKCIEDFTIFLDEVPDAPGALYWRGWAWLELGEYEKALVDFDRLIEVEPEDAANYYARGMAKYFLNRSAEAEQDLRKAEELHADDAYTVHYLGHALESQGRLEEALLYKTRSLELQPGVIEWYCCVADVLLRLERHDEAVEMLGTSIDKDPNQAQAYFTLAEHRARQGDQDAAKKNYELAARMPEEKPGKSQEDKTIEIRYRGRACAALGRHEDALAHYEQALTPAKRKERFHEHHFWIARSLDALGRHAEALASYRLGLENALVCHEPSWIVEHCQNRITELEALLASPMIHLRSLDIADKA